MIAVIRSIRAVPDRRHVALEETISAPRYTGIHLANRVDRLTPLHEGLEWVHRPRRRAHSSDG